MTRSNAIAAAQAAFDDGRLWTTLARRVAMQTASQPGGEAADFGRYFEAELVPDLEAMGFACRVHPNPSGHQGRFLVAERVEDAGLPTVLTYGHGDVVPGYDDEWSSGGGPWTLTEREGRWYGRGAADNKGQHLINLEALKAVLAARGRLGFNVVALFEMGEEAGSPGLDAFCAANRDALRADVLVASDGPRLRADRPTLFLGSRGIMTFDLELDLRDGSHHSGNWGGVLANAGLVLAHVLASIVTRSGQIRVVGWRPTNVPADVYRAVSTLELDHAAGLPVVDPNWGEPGLTDGEKVYAWPSFQVLSFTCGNPELPANAIPSRAVARCELRFVPPVTPDTVVPPLRAHLDERGYGAVRIVPDKAVAATRLGPDHPLVAFAADSILRTTGKRVTVLPNLGGSLPNAVFAETLGLPTLWVPHSYPGCRQHAADEHVLPELLREGLAMMAGLWWDVGEGLPPVR
ncbi:MAG: M20 family metallopeptidase [Pseudomonadota bacterium]